MSPLGLTFFSALATGVEEAASIPHSAGLLIYLASWWLSFAPLRVGPYLAEGTPIRSGTCTTELGELASKEMESVGRRRFHLGRVRNSCK